MVRVICKPSDRIRRLLPYVRGAVETCFVTLPVRVNGHTLDDPMPYKAHYSSFHFLFHHPHITPV